MREFKNSPILVFTGLLTVCLAVACTSPYPSNVTATLKAAGDNRAELEEVLDYFTEKGDSLQLQAAYYLIGNMEGHSFVTYDLLDTSGQNVPFDVLDYPDYDAAILVLDSIKKEHGELDFKSEIAARDVETITAEFLIDNIELAFEAWRTRPWAKDLSFGDFCDGVLPYRGSSEPLEPWRREFMARYADLESKMKDSTDPAEAASLINDDIMKWFTFDPLYYLHPTDQSMRQMLASGLGRCEDMTNITIYAMRANGLAVTSDYTPHWANTGNNHAWNAIITPTENSIPFMGAEAAPRQYKLHNRLAKAYRKLFAKQPGNLGMIKPDHIKVPGWLRGKSYKDVTGNYVDVCDVTIEFDNPVPDSVSYAYLCVFNSGDWRAIHWAPVDNGKAVFTDMGMEIAYCPAFYLNEELVPCGPPFILDADGIQHPIVADTTTNTLLNLTNITIRAQLSSTDGVAKYNLTPEQEYELFCWQNGWRSLGQQTATGQPLAFTAPADGLYWLVAKDSRKDERIFTWENGRQIWW